MSGILVFNNGYLSPGLSGGARNILELAREWARTESVVVVVPDVAQDVVPAGVPVVSYPSRFPRGLWDTVWTYAARMRWVARLLPTNPVQVVVSSSSLLHDVWPAWQHRRLHGSRMAVFVFHLIPKRVGNGRRLQFLLAALGQRLCLRLYRDADVLFAGNALVRDALVAKGIPPGRVHIYYPVVDRAAIEGATPIERYDGLFIGRIVERKGIFDVLDAVEGLGIRVGMVGDGEDRERLESEIRRRGMGDQVDVLGALPDAEMHGLLRGCRFFLFPSREEGYGMVIAEAMIAGKPVITYALPHYAEAFGDGLIAVPLGDGIALRAAVENFLAGRIDAAACVARYRQARLFTREESAAFCLARLRGVA